MEFQPPDISNFFHKITKNKKFTSPPLEPSAWPQEWKTIYFKEYPRMPRIDLKPYLKPLPEIPLWKLLLSRKSRRNFNDKPINISQISNLLYWASGIRNLEKHLEKKDWQSSYRFYASGGGRYPLEIYPLVLKGEGELRPSLYHYNVKEHILENIWDRDFLKYEKEWLEGALSYPWSRDAAVILFITAVFWRNQIKYGERGYRYILQESGHLGQNLYLVSETLGLQCCALGGFAEEEVERVLDIDGISESCIYTFAIGVK
jgi:SagB-type dehydrogenase family enzyme